MLHLPGHWCFVMLMHSSCTLTLFMDSLVDAVVEQGKQRETNRKPSIIPGDDWFISRGIHYNAEKIFNWRVKMFQIKDFNPFFTNLLPGLLFCSTGFSVLPAVA